MTCVFSIQEQIEWAVEEGADYIIAETFETLGEAMLALKAVQQYGNGKEIIKRQHANTYLNKITTNEGNILQSKVC